MKKGETWHQAGHSTPVTPNTNIKQTNSSLLLGFAGPVLAGMKGGFFNRSKANEGSSTGSCQPSSSSAANGGSASGSSKPMLISGILEDKFDKPGEFERIQRSVGLPYVQDLYTKFLGPDWQRKVYELKLYVADMMNMSRVHYFPVQLLKLETCLARAVDVEIDDPQLKKEMDANYGTAHPLVTYMAEYHTFNTLRLICGLLSTLKAVATRMVSPHPQKPSCLCAERKALLNFAAPLFSPSHTYMHNSYGIDGKQVPLCPSEETLLQLRTEPCFVMLALEMHAADGMHHSNNGVMKSSGATKILDNIAFRELDTVTDQQLGKLILHDHAAHAFGICLRSKNVWVLQVVLHLLKRATASGTRALCPILVSSEWLPNWLACIDTVAGLTAYCESERTAVSDIRKLVEWFIHDLPKSKNQSTVPDEAFSWPDAVVTRYSVIAFKASLSDKYPDNKRNEGLIAFERSGWCNRGHALFAAENAVLAIGTALEGLGITTFSRPETAKSLKVLAAIMRTATPEDRGSLIVRHDTALDALTKLLSLWGETYAFTSLDPETFLRASEKRREAQRKAINEIGLDREAQLTQQLWGGDDMMVQSLWMYQREPEYSYKNTCDGLVQALELALAFYPASIPVDIPPRISTFYYILPSRLSRLLEDDEAASLWFRNKKSMQPVLKKAKEVLQSIREDIKMGLRGGRGVGATNGKGATSSNSSGNTSKAAASSTSNTSAAATSSSPGGSTSKAGKEAEDSSKSTHTCNTSGGASSSSAATAAAPSTSTPAAAQQPTGKIYTCQGCATTGLGFKRCSVCGARFCSAVCQKESWKRHKAVCKPQVKK